LDTRHKIITSSRPLKKIVYWEKHRRAPVIGLHQQLLHHLPIKIIKDPTSSKLPVPVQYFTSTMTGKHMACLEMWLWLLFKVFFMLKCIKMMFFIFKKLFLRSTHQNDPKHIKKLIFHKKIYFFLKHGLARVSKRFLSYKLVSCNEELFNNAIKFC
jgi:hypothetical protein